jgi:hypothetical protein
MYISDKLFIFVKFSEYSIIMTRIISLELLPQGNLDSSRGDSQGSHIPA